jgi:hypothetical protein
MVRRGDPEWESSDAGTIAIAEPDRGVLAKEIVRAGTDGRVAEALARCARAGQAIAIVGDVCGFRAALGSRCKGYDVVCRACRIARGKAPLWPVGT